jgi:hypothetical protein
MKDFSIDHYSADHLNQVSRLADGLTPEKFQDFKDCLLNHKPKEGIALEYIHACHDAVTGLGVDFI